MASDSYIVVSSVSSGKSTFINSLLGEKILPSRNQACTSKILNIKNSEDDGVCAEVLKSHGQVEEIVDVSPESIIKYQKNDDNELLTISTNFLGRIEKKIEISDTPGINNSIDLSDGKSTYKYLSTLRKATVIYIISALEIGTEDDLKALKIIEQLRKDKDIKLVILFNKIDEINLEEEDIDEIKQNITELLHHSGVTGNIPIYMISSKAALLFQLVLSERELTKNEKIEFRYLYEKFIENTFDLLYEGDIKIKAKKESKISSFFRKVFKKKRFYLIDGKEYSKENILYGLKSTGIGQVKEFLSKGIGK